MVTGLSWKEMEWSQALGPQYGWSSDAAALSNRLLHSPAILKKLPRVRLPDVHNPDVSALPRGSASGVGSTEKGLGWIPSTSSRVPRAAGLHLGRPCGPVAAGWHPRSSLSRTWPPVWVVGATGWDTLGVKSEWAGWLTTSSLSASAWTPGSHLLGAGSAATHPPLSLTWSLPQTGQLPRPPPSAQKPPALMTPESLTWLVAPPAWAQCFCPSGSSLSSA